MLVLPIAALFVGCKSTLTAVSGKYYYYETTDNRVTFFSWNPMSQQYHTAVLMEADPKTFTQVTSQYGKNASHVFHKGLPIAGADPSTFVLLKKGYTVDSKSVFFTIENGWRGQTLEPLSD